MDISDDYVNYTNKRIAELEEERNLAEGRIDELEQENKRLRDEIDKWRWLESREFKKGMERAAEIVRSHNNHKKCDMKLALAEADIRAEIDKER